MIKIHTPKAIIPKVIGMPRLAPRSFVFENKSSYRACTKGHDGRENAIFSSKNNFVFFDFIIRAASGFAPTAPQCQTTAFSFGGQKSL